MLFHIANAIVTSVYVTAERDGEVQCPSGQGALYTPKK